MGFKNLSIDLSYAGKGENILHHFLLPVISESVYYDRITGFYSVESLLAISQGIEAIYKRHGKMRLIIGIHDFPVEYVDASIRRKQLKEHIDRIRAEIADGISTITDKLQKERLATLAWMVEDDLLEIKAASVEGPGIFHPKTLILSDNDGERIVAVGSPNETPSGLGGNFEQLMVATSWQTPVAVKTQEDFFDSLWNDDHDDVDIIDISEDTADTILSSLGSEYTRKRAHVDRSTNDGLIKTSAKMLANFFVAGDIPALYVHQERAVIEALSRWPVRVLFADEVGLGKTFEVAATMSFLLKNCGIKRVMILTPKSVIQQWQDELSEHFHINAWRFESNSRTYFDTNGHSISMGIRRNPISKGSPDVILMSAQYARGSGNSGDVFSSADAIFPDLLIVDEAHSVRVSESVSGKTQKTRMYGMLESVARRIPHLILATATPMQKDANEYHAILKLIGLSKAWQKTRNYQTSLRLIASQDTPDTSDAYSAASLLLKTIADMAPDLSKLEPLEYEAVKKLLSLQKTADEYEMGSFIQKNWPAFQSAFIKLHPAHLLTVRNTRRSLSEVGYKFPKRNLFEESIEDSMPIQLFYNKVEQYLSNESFSIEQVLYPKRTISLGFIRVSYRQRLASSLFSCKESLSRRYERVLAVKKALEERKQPLSSDDTGFDPSLYWDALDSDELLCQDIDETSTGQEEIDVRALRRAVGIESTALSSLIKEADLLLKDHMDLKIIRSIHVAKQCLQNGDSVLLFSRYTDTIDALLDEFNRTGDSNSYVFGVYTGQQSKIVARGVETPCDKNTLKQELFSGKLKIVFCSDAASEGLNLQAARVLINVDVPWTPARLEQRIGRIARLGQTANEVDIYNVWYPYSIEARMYHRIQKRLDETNLAIGEFPEIVATSIRNAVLDGTEEDNSGVEQLKEIRNSYQTSALEALWHRSGDGTESEIIRKELMGICEREFSQVGSYLDGTIKSYQMPDGSTVDLTSKDGMPESISLLSKPWQFIDFKDARLFTINDSKGNPAAFSLELAGEKRLITHESALHIILDNDLASADMLVGRPKMLPDSSRLDLRFSIDSECPVPPEYWID